MGRDLELEGAWRDRIRRHERSDLTIGQFCAQENLVPHQLFWWRRELKRRDAEAGRTNAKRKTKRTGSSKAKKHRDPPSAKGFVPVQIAAFAPSNAPIEIVVDHRLRIAVAPGFDVELLAQVVRTLENR